MLSLNTSCVLADPIFTNFHLLPASKTLLATFPSSAHEFASNKPKVVEIGAVFEFFWRFEVFLPATTAYTRFQSITEIDEDFYTRVKFEKCYDCDNLKLVRRELRARRPGISDVFN